jgi:hypothetical protein
VNEDKLDCEWTNLEVIDHTLHGYVSAKQGQFMKRREAQLKEQYDSYFEAEG